MPFITQGKANLKYILIVVILAAIVGGGILGYWYWKEGDIPSLPIPHADCMGIIFNAIYPAQDIFVASEELIKLAGQNRSTGQNELILLTENNLKECIVKDYTEDYSIYNAKDIQILKDNGFVSYRLDYICNEIPIKNYYLWSKDSFYNVDVSLAPCDVKMPVINNNITISEESLTYYVISDILKNNIGSEKLCDLFSSEYDSLDISFSDDKRDENNKIISAEIVEINAPSDLCYIKLAQAEQNRENVSFWENHCSKIISPLELAECYIENIGATRHRDLITNTEGKGICDEMTAKLANFKLSQAVIEGKIWDISPDFALEDYQYFQNVCYDVVDNPEPRYIQIKAAAFFVIE